MDHRELFIFILGISLVAFVSFDIFHTIILPRITLLRVRIARILVGWILWPAYFRIVRILPKNWQTGWLEMFAPMAFVTLLTTWLLGLITGFALVIYALGHYFRPPVLDLTDAIYFAGTSILTLGFGDATATDWPARFVVLLAAVLGVIFMALVVSLMFSMLSYLQVREQVVNTLMSRAGLPPSGVVLLSRYRELNIVGGLSSAFVAWELWLASILESHRAFPLLMYFRSSSAGNSWLATVGATMDAACLLLSSVEDHSVGEADLYYWMGVTALKSFANNFGLEPIDRITVDQKDYTQALQLLQDAGYKVRDAATTWPRFEARRSGYMRHLIPLAERFASPEHVWLPEFKSYSVAEV